MTTIGALKFRKKPVVVEALPVPDPDDMHGWGNLIGWLMVHEVDFYVSSDYDAAGHEVVIGVDIPTTEGVMLARIGWWVLRGTRGEFYPCRPDAFADSYEEYIAPGVAEPPADDPMEKIFRDLIAVGEDGDGSFALSKEFGEYVAMEVSVELPEDHDALAPRVRRWIQEDLVDAHEDLAHDTVIAGAPPPPPIQHIEVRPFAKETLDNWRVAINHDLDDDDLLEMVDWTKASFHTIESLTAQVDRLVDSLRAMGVEEDAIEAVLNSEW